METPEQVMNRINTDEDVLKDNGLTLEQFDKSCEGLEADERATRFVKLLVKSLNQGWTPDFNDTSQTKYEPYFLGGSSGFRFYDYDACYSDSNVGSRLCFKSRELVEHAGKKFTQWYKQIIVIK